MLFYGNPATDTIAAPLRSGLRDFGYIEGQNLLIEYRHAEGKPERLPDLAAELVRLQPDVLLAAGGDVAPFAVKATQTIPIVFIMSADPQQLIVLFLWLSEKFGAHAASARTCRT